MHTKRQLQGFITVWQSGYKSTMIKPFFSSLSQLTSAVIFASTVRIDTQLKPYHHIHHPSSSEAYNTCSEGGTGRARDARAVSSARSSMYHTALLRKGPTLPQHETYSGGRGWVGEQMMSVYGAAVRCSHPSTRAPRAAALRDGGEETV